MKSIFILGGGFEWKDTFQMKRISDLILNKFSKPKILDVWFAQTNEESAKHDKIFEEIYKNNNILFERKIATKNNFLEECKWADVINIHGGNSNLLFSNMEEYSLSVFNENKIVIGSSAGAKILASYSPNWDGKTLRKGRGVLPLNVIVHYGDNSFLDDGVNWNDIVKSLEQSSYKLSVILEEKDIRAFYQDGTEIDI